MLIDRRRSTSFSFDHCFRTGATKVHVFSHITRKDSREEAESAVKNNPDLQDGNAPYQKVTPARFIHVDFSNDGSVQIFKDNFGAEYEGLSKTRWGLINVSYQRPLASFEHLME